MAISSSTKAQMNQDAYEVLVGMILKPTPPKANKEHDQLVWDECKRYILSCIEQNIRVVS